MLKHDYAAAIIDLEGHERGREGDWGMKKIYIVQGSTGEYSDRMEWPVCAFEQAERAKELAERLSEMARLVFIKCGGNTDMAMPEVKAIVELDPRFLMDYTGTFYTVYDVEVRK